MLLKISLAAAVFTFLRQILINSYALRRKSDGFADIEVPEGVDPAFLAALPEDIRAEVIRDHERQQRAQRLAQSAASGAAEGAPGDEAAAAGGSSAPGVEPLDQEFLNALPPELQEEILAQHERTVRLANERAENAASSSGTGSTEYLLCRSCFPESISCVEEEFMFHRVRSI